MVNQLIAYKHNKRFYLKTVGWRNMNKFHVIEFIIPPLAFEYKGGKYIHFGSLRGKILRHGFCFDSREQAENYLAKYIQHTA